jgi:small subunit ribosomal protein S20
MANRRQSIKKIRVDKRRREHNVRVLSELKTVLRKTGRLLLEKNQAEITQQSRALFSKLDKAVKKNLLHKNRASRIKSRVQQKVNSLKRRG